MNEHVSFFMVDDVENQSIFLIAEKYIHMGICFGYLYPISSGVVQITSVLQNILQCPDVSPEQSWAIALVMSERQDGCYGKLSGGQT